MEISKLVESIVAPFLEGLNDEPLEKLEQPKKSAVDENTQKVINLFSECEYDEIKALGSACLQHPQPLTNFLSDRPTIIDKVISHFSSATQDESWEEAGNEMAAKIGYQVVDYLDGEKKIEPATQEPEISVNLSDEHTFLDVAGVVCEEYSHRDKIRAVLYERLKKKH